MKQDLFLVQQTWDQIERVHNTEIFEQIKTRAFLLLIPLPVIKSWQGRLKVTHESL